ncbi:MAG: diphosphomevalonate decarboxylase [Bacteroidota bacterium]
MTEQDFVLSFSEDQMPESGRVSWSSPSNIALIKYWGKKENQIPANPSISFTLDACKTNTELTYNKRPFSDEYSFEVLFKGGLKPEFHPKIETFFKRIEAYVPFIKNYHFKIETKNTFPHSSGIASSASGMSALAMCLMSLEKEITVSASNDINDGDYEDYFKSKASFLARLGSGSAARSIDGPMVSWGYHEDYKNSSDLFGTVYDGEVNEAFHNYQDAILLVDKDEKQVSSTVGHNLMHKHPFANERFQQANANMSQMKEILAKGDLDAFIALVEGEALTLHAMMMTSQPYFILMRPNTLEIINRIWNYRKETGYKACFTLDAGANVHLLFPENEKPKVYEFIKNELVAYCQNGHYICDNVGHGAQELKNDS